MYMQQEILQWLAGLNINQLKHIITVKHPRNVSYLKQILQSGSEEETYKPIDRISHGYSQTNLNTQRSMYLREKYRYKKKKEEKIAMNAVLFQNITVSRVSSFAFSVRKSFIASAAIKECLLLFSDSQAFNFYPLKQMHVKLGGETTPRSVWFETNRINSFSEWLMSFFEIQIWEAYTQRNELSAINHFTYIQESITKDSIKAYIRNILVLYSEKRHSGKYAKKTSKKEGLYGGEEEDCEPIDVQAEEVPYLLTRCLQKFEEADRGLEEVLLEYVWYSEDNTTKVSRLLRDACKIIVRKFKDYEIDLKVKELQALSQSKKKKKRGKKAKDETEAPEKVEEKVERTSDDPSAEKVEEPHVKVEEKPEQPLIIAEISPKEESSQSQKPKDPKDDKPRQQKPKKKSKNKLRTKHKKQQSLQKLQYSQKMEKFAKEKKVSLKEEAKKMGHIVNQRINQHICSFYDQLSLSSQSIDRYRKICIQTVENTIKEMELKFKWELAVFGSYSVDFALRESDLDLLLVTDDPAFTLNAVRDHLKVKQWLRGCNIIQIQSAKVNILEFQILLSCLKHPKLKDPKKLKEVIHIDLSLTTDKNSHEGIRNTEIMKTIFGSFPKMRVISLIFKELLRVYQLNKPFLGGIGSFVLVILLHNIIEMRKIKMDQNYCQQLVQICTFMTDYFQPYKTLISSAAESTLEVNPKLELNIEDPKDKVLLNTTKVRQINEIIQVCDQLKTTLAAVQSQLLTMNAEERKKMKRAFFEKWNILFRPHEPSIEEER